MSSSERERRTHILQVAERLLRHYGPQKTTIAEIARAADVGVGTVYLEFPSKESIVEELSSVRHRLVLDAMRSAVKSGRTYSERLAAVFDARLRAFIAVEEEGAHARDLVHCMNSAVRSVHARFKEEELALLSDLLREAEEAGEFELRCSVEEAACAVLMAYVSFAPPYVLASDKHDLERRLATMHRLLLEGLKRRQA